MTATLDGVTKKKDKPEPSVEQKLAEELVARAREQGVALTGPGGLLKQLTKAVLCGQARAWVPEMVWTPLEPVTGRVSCGLRSSGSGERQIGAPRRQGSAPCE
jgi:hypothetical protein